jgi:hypothetical protein
LAGAKRENAEVVGDEGVITSRNPADLDAFSAKIIEEVKEGRHKRRVAAWLEAGGTSRQLVAAPFCTSVGQL